MLKTGLKIEELMMLILGCCLFSTLSLSWWWFIGLFFLPDIGMVGYMIDPKVGAIIYNIFHHKGIAILLYILGMWFSSPYLQLVGIVLFSHAAFDRIWGYGLKYSTSFKDTHLGKIGK